MAEMTFTDLNVLFIESPERKQSCRFGLIEEEISHSRGLITKNEIRAATLHRLRLPQKGVFWDIGGGSGSISVEAASLNPDLLIYTVERKDEELLNIKENIRKFRCYNIIPVSGHAAAVIDTLPDPDVVFIGGSGGELEEIIQHAASRLSKDGRIVVNSVTEKTAQLTPPIMEQCGLTIESSTIEVSRSDADGTVCFNPITIMVGKK